MSGHDIIVIGASAGGVEALVRLTEGLPADLPASVFITLHFPSDSTSVLPHILNRRSALHAEHASDGEAVRPGRIYVAPPDRHLLLKDGYVRVVRGPRENGHRPAVDPMFRTAARAYGPRVIGVILSGTLDDGTSGLLTVKERGGLAVVQDPDDAPYDGMPRSAIEHVKTDAVVPLAELAETLTRLARLPADPPENDPMPEDLNVETDMAELEMNALQDPERPGHASPYSCPECGGSLFELVNSGILRFRCRVGHAYTADSLLVNMTDSLEEALWVALRALEESAALSQRLLNRARDRGQQKAAVRFLEQADDARDRAALIRNVLLNNDLGTQARDAASEIPSPEG